jgi:L-aminopeptidase/D-esterase-like protein
MPSIADVEGVRVGHWTDEAALTGCTVVLPPAGTIASCEVRGGAPGTRGTDILQPGTIIEVAHAVVLTGGSAFGLDAAAGVMQYLESRGVGFAAGAHRVPIVPAAVIFDLNLGSSKARPDPGMARWASKNAAVELVEGSVGAGTGATVGNSSA